MSLRTGNSQKPATYIRIHKDTLLRNYHCFAAGGVDIAPVIKSNAYGHDAYQVARCLSENTEAPFFVVAAYDQARKLREQGIAKPILILGYVPAETVADNQYHDITFTAVDNDHLHKLEAELTKTQPIHLKVDTGMHRYGVPMSELDEAMELLDEARHVVITGIFSHLSDAFADLNDFTTAQIAAFNDVAGRMKERFPSCRVTHLASTSSHAFRGEIEANTERVGIGLYGLANFTDEFHTEPALSFVSTIASIRTVSAGESVGYSRTFSPDEERRIATIPAGYFEGVDRRLSNCGVVRIDGEVCPIVGKVSMNATTIDVTDCTSQPEVGDTVEIISADPQAPNSAAAVAETIDAVNYRITTQLPARLPRFIV